MIQRIQSIYLFIAGFCVFALYLFPLAHNVVLNGIPTTIKATGLYQMVNGQEIHTEVFVALTAVTAIIGLLPIIIIFLYKNRKKQITFCYSAILVIIGFSFWMAQTVKAVTGGVTIEPNNMGIGLFLSSISIVMLIFAAKAIQRDEKLVKSADRLR